MSDKHHYLAMACGNCHAAQGKCCRNSYGDQMPYCEGRVIRDKLPQAEINKLKAEGRRKQAAWERAKKLALGGFTRLAAYKCEECGAEDGLACRDENDNLAPPCEQRKFKLDFMQRYSRKLHKMAEMQ